MSGAAMGTPAQTQESMMLPAMPNVSEASAPIPQRMPAGDPWTAPKPGNSPAKQAAPQMEEQEIIYTIPPNGAPTIVGTPSELSQSLLPAQNFAPDQQVFMSQDMPPERPSLLRRIFQRR
jgi:hypothetical protein